MSRKHGDGCTFRQRDVKEAIKGQLDWVEDVLVHVEPYVKPATH